MKFTNIWKFNKTTGYWMLVRDSWIENAHRWLSVFQGDEPGAYFKISKSRPKMNPTNRGLT